MFCVSVLHSGNPYICSVINFLASECVDMEVNCVEMETDSFSKCADEINELGSLIGIQRNLDELDHGKFVCTNKLY